jgi:NTP pyrophosphatase (non-canonical NTP hydrolase)
MAGQALMFLISEIGELTEAYLTRERGKLPAGMVTILVDMQYIGQRADKWVSAQEEQWVRNHDRKKEPNVESEVADCLMMLERFASQLGIDPLEALVCKMRDKGFVPVDDPGVLK